MSTSPPITNNAPPHQDQDDLVSHLPAELRTQIVHHLDTPDLALLSRVSKDWRQTCIPYLWKDIQLLTRPQLGGFFGKPATLGLGCYGGCYTRTFKTRFPESIWPLLDVDIQQEKKETEGKQDEEGKKRIQLERFDLLLPQESTNLLPSDADPSGRSIILTNETYYIMLNKFLQTNICTRTLHTLHIYRIPPNPIRLLETIAVYLPGLKVLHLFAGGGVPYRRMPCLGPEAARKFLENCPSGLEELAFGVKIKGDQPPELRSMVLPSDQEQGTSRRKLLTHPELRILSLPGAMNGYEEQVLAAGEGGFLQGCTGLEVIESSNDALLRNYWITDNTTIRTVLSREGGAGAVTESPLHGRVLRRFCASMADNGLPQPTQEQQQSQLPLPQPIQQQQPQEEVNPSERDERLADSIWAIQRTNQASAEHAATLPTGPGLPAFVVRKEVWHTIVVHGAGPLVAQAIVHTSSHQDGMLVALELIDPQGVTSQHIQQILVNSKYLRCFEVSHSDTPPTRTSSALHGLDPLRTRLLATDMLTASKWGCLLLTNLHLEIGGIPRINKSTTADTSNFDQQESHRIQRQVYRQLSALTRLQELRLGRACERQDIEDYEAHQHQHQHQQEAQNVPGFQRDCLEMTLESGLDLLLTLTELSVVDLSRMDHCVGVPELQWMRRHWPHLRALRGVSLPA
ncbi:hypothetical protein BG015_000500 [Linnemannia schmuckeri]|uniref:F-box domain-containing protein n=1 Tax=Linnemannia schmuckeri TaxID=64567 RepID=A0A9P5S4E3_9FUNG|nr:hypothetical protein BG015_000500 [Linnemannia schmuckeri]